MDLEKIGNFIAKCRKEKNLTQNQLAEKLCVTDKAVSKWECGKGLPDISIMMDLCNLLGINIIDLLTGEKTNTKYYIHKTEGSMVKKMTIEKSLKGIQNTDDLSNSLISEIQDVNGKKYNAVFKVIVDGFDILETEEYTKVTMEISDETGEMTAILINTKNEAIKKMIKELKIGQYYFIKGLVVLNEDVTGNKLLIIDAIKRVA